MNRLASALARSPLCLIATAAVAACAALAGSARAAPDAPAPTAAEPPRSSDLSIAFERYRLANGLEVILHQDNRVPIVAVDLWYHVGAGDERPGKSGFAHLFEHMLFQGSKHVGEDAHFDVLRNIGASAVNGSTTYDRTNYYQVVPSNRLETALWLESDRMGYLLPLLTQESFDNQVDVVRNERRLRHDNVAYGPSDMRAYELLYPEGHPYRYRVIGLHEELESASLADVRNFYKIWYVPANATLVIAGDFDSDRAKQLVTKWFGTFPTTSKPAHTTPPPPQLGQTVRETVSEDFAKLRRINYSWHSPAIYGSGDAELEILADALADAGTGRLYKRLVHEEQLAQSVYAYQYGKDFSGIFRVGVTLKSNADLARVEAIVAEELAKVTSQPLDPAEIRRAVVARESSMVWQLESVLARAEALQRYNHATGEPDWITEDLDRYRSATPASVLAAATSVLSQPRVELLTTPTTAPSEPSAHEDQP